MTPRWPLLRLRLLLGKGGLRHALLQTPLKPLFLTLMGIAFLALETFIFYRIFHFLFGVLDPSLHTLSRALSLHLLRMLFLVFGMMLVYSNLVTAISVYLTASDMPLLLVLPVRSLSLYFSKYVETLARSSLTLAVFMVPALATYGYARQAEAVFYLWIPPLLLFFLLIPVSIAVPIMLFLARIFPAKRLQQGLIALGLLATTAALFAFRLWRVEDVFARGASAEQMMRWAQGFKLPTASRLPSGWLVEAIDDLLSRSTPGPGAARLIGWALVSVALSCAAGAPLLRDTWSRAFGATTSRLGKVGGLRFGAFRLPGLSRADSAMVLKEIKVFTRDLSRWSQIVMMFPLIGFYLLNMHLLPFRDQFKALYYLLNLFMIAFIVAAIGARYLYPSVSWEGPALWLVRVSPYPVWRLVVIQFLLFSLPLLVLTVTLIVFSFYILGFPWPVLLTSLVLGLGTTVFLSALAVGFGALLPRFRYEHHLEISLGPGGLLYMLTSFAVSFVFMMVLAYPVFLGMGAKARYWGHWDFSDLVLPTLAARYGWLLFCLVGTGPSLLMGVVSLSRREEFDR